MSSACAQVYQQGEAHTPTATRKLTRIAHYAWPKLLNDFGAMLR